MDRSLVPYCAVATAFASLAALASLASGCGFGSPSATPDGQPPSPDPDAPSTDGGVDGPPAVSCLARWYDGTVAFEAPTHIAELAAPEMDRDPFLSPDELTIYFASYRSTAQNGDIFTAKRSAIGSPFSAPQRDSGISSSATDSRFSMTANELIAVVASDRTGTEGNSDIWIASRLSKVVPFGPFLQTGVSNINGSDNERDPEISADGLRIYLSAGNPQRVVVSSRSGLGGAFSSTQPLANLAGSSGGDADPALSPDERIIVFASTRGGNGDGNLYYATRADKNADFGAPVNVSDVNSNANDGDPALSADGCRLYFASDRAGGNWELYVASMAPQQ